jgi:D-glycero-D-manno-heptose 1,7-bisphosphate phosphatase
MVISSLKKAVFLDRDGVINKSIVVDGKPKAPFKIEEIELLPDVFQSIHRLKQNGYAVVVISNQPDVARAAVTRKDSEKVNEAIIKLAGIDHSYICFHDDADKCICRKPSPGNIFAAATDLNLDLAASYLVGDRWRDIEAGQKAGCKCFYIKYSYEEKKPSLPYVEVSSLSHAVDCILEKVSLQWN